MHDAIYDAIGPDTLALLDEAEANMSPLTAYMRILYRMSTKIS